VKALVTGAAGFIGSTLVDRLLAEGHEVTGVDDMSRGRPENLASARRAAAFRFERCDVAAPELADVLRASAPEVVFHLAAQIDVRVSVADPLVDLRANVQGTVNLAEAARCSGVGKVVLASSGGSIYGAPELLPVDEAAPVDPHSPYAAGKVAAELYLAAYAAMYGLRFTSLALGNVYGPRQDPAGEAGVVAIFIGAMLEGRPTQIFGDGTATRDYVYVDDVVDAFVRAGERGDGRRFNIGTGEATSVQQLHGMIAKLCGVDAEPRLLPARLGELQGIALNSAAAAAALDWRPRVGLAEGLRLTAAWLRGEQQPRR
jgi:UDP-glucose 4-epimerase